MNCDTMQRMKKEIWKHRGFDEGEMKGRRQRDKDESEKAALEK